MKSIYCTVMSRPFVLRALALQNSLAQTAADALFAFFCIDETTAPFLRGLDLKNVLVFAPDDFETAELRGIKRTVTAGEYCWTCKSVALLHAFNSVSDLDWAVWVDSDMFSFGNPDEALELYANADVILTPHRFALPEFKSFEPTVGRFNAGYAAFRNTENGRASLTWWRDRCFEACSGAPTGENYGDQKYLGRMVEQFNNVAEADIAGLNCAPWNVLDLQVEREGDCILVSNFPLLLYHFQGLKVIRPWLFDLYASSQFPLPGNLRKIVYEPYLQALESQLGKASGEGKGGYVGADEEFAGASGLYAALKRLTWSKNMKVWL